MPKTMIEKVLPFAVLYLAEDRNLGLIATAQGALAIVDKLVGIPRRTVGHRQRSKDGVIANTVEPILGVGEIALAAMHDPVPIAARWRRDVLADRVRLVKEIVKQPQTRQATATHRCIDDLVAFESGLYRKRCECIAHRTIWLTHVERHRQTGRNERCDSLAVRVRIKLAHDESRLRLSDLTTLNRKRNRSQTPPSDYCDETSELPLILRARP
jgi:hypothetical protein